MANFGEWKAKEFDCIYNKFESDQDRRWEKDEARFRETMERRFNVETTPSYERHLKLYHWRRDYLNSILWGDRKINVNVPCMSCGKDTKNARNHTYPRNLIKKYLSKDGHVYGLQMATRGEERIEITEGISTDEALDIDQWIFRDLKIKKQGIRESASIFHGFCSHCDNKIFEKADNESLLKGDRQAIVEQMYRVACSTYYKSLDHIVKLCYVKEKEEQVAFRVGDYSLDTTLQYPSGSEEAESSMSGHIRGFLDISHKLYNLVLDLQKNRSCPERVTLSHHIIKVKMPSVACGFFRINKGRYEVKTNETSGIILPIDYVGALGLIYPISNTEIFFCLSGFPLGIDPLNKDIAEDLFAPYADIIDKNIHTVLSKIVLENYWSTKNLIISPEFYCTLSKEQKDAFCSYPYVGKNNVPEINLFT